MKRRNLLTAIYILIVFIASCSDNDPAQPAGNGTITGVSGSLARFAIAGDHLYTVSNTEMNLYKVSDPKNPVFQIAVYPGTDIETIFPFGNNLFIGTQTGMQIFDISSPESPERLSIYQHWRSCDPVTANTNYAFATLRSGSGCNFGDNQLDVVDITSLRQPVLVKSYPMTNPYGLALDGTNLFVCDNGIKFYDASDVRHLTLKHDIPIAATDVIAANGLLLVTGSDGLYQYDYSGGRLTLLSKIPTKH